MSEVIITMIYPANIAQVWADVMPLLESAVDKSGTHTIEDIYLSLMGGKSQLWVQWSGKVDAAVTTEFVNYPRGLWFRFWLAGAVKDADVLWQKFYDTLYEFAKNNQCVGIEDCGREGWNRYAPHARKISTLRRIEIEE